MAFHKIVSDNQNMAETHMTTKKTLVIQYIGYQDNGFRETETNSF